MNTLGIKETLELVKSLEILGVTVKKISKDGIQVSDLVHLVELANKMEVVLAGFKGLDVLKDELSNLDQSEVIQIIGALYNAADAINQA